MKTEGIIGHKIQLSRIDMMLKNNMIPQTMLFSGISGIGKKKIARCFFKTLFCENDDGPCLKCPSCIRIEKGSHGDMIEVQPNEKGIIPIGKSDEEGTVRWLIDRLSKKSFSGGYGVIINGVEKIPVQGQNALLKTIEEPSAGTKIILITSNRSLMLPTILSRCTEISFQQLSSREIRAILEKHDIGGDIELLSEMSGGSVELAEILSDDDIFSGILGIASDISSFLINGKLLELNIDDIQKKVGIEHLLFILVNLYRMVLIGNLGGSELNSVPGDIIIDDDMKLRKLIKILISLRKGISNNLNIRHALKAMLYSIDDIDPVGLPGLDMDFR